MSSVRGSPAGSSSVSFVVRLGSQKAASVTLAISLRVIFQAIASSYWVAVLDLRWAALHVGPTTPDQRSTASRDASPPTAIHDNRVFQLLLVRAAGDMAYPLWHSAAATVCVSSTARASASRACWSSARRTSKLADC